jgi:hypothetical protein
MTAPAPTASPLPALAAALLDPHHPLPAGLRHTGLAPLEARLDVYRNNVTTTLAGALAETFEVCEQLVGTAFFRTAAVHYLREHPPRSPLLWRHGEGFADFLASYAPAASLPYLPDMARLEWLRQCAWRAPDATALAPDALAALLQAPHRLPACRLLLAPSLQVLRSAHPVVSGWAAHQGLRPWDGWADAGPEAALVTRDAHDAVVLPVPHATAAWVAGLAAGHTLGEAVAGASAPQPDGLTLDLMAAWQLLMTHGALLHITPPEGDPR